MLAGRSVFRIMPTLPIVPAIEKRRSFSFRIDRLKN